MDIFELQNKLYRLGLLSQENISGVFDVNTRNAIKSFQAMSGLVPTGNLSGDTGAAIDLAVGEVSKAEAALNEYAPTPTEENGEDIKDRPGLGQGNWRRPGGRD
jgi:peptidoglycan hydrolase-like protein with peptidoglycan-binding domain